MQYPSFAPPMDSVVGSSTSVTTTSLPSTSLPSTSLPFPSTLATTTTLPNAFVSTSAVPAFSSSDAAISGFSSGFSSTGFSTTDYTAALAASIGGYPTVAAAPASSFSSNISYPTVGGVATSTYPVVSSVAATPSFSTFSGNIETPASFPSVTALGSYPVVGGSFVTSSTVVPTVAPTAATVSSVAPAVSSYPVVGSSYSSSSSVVPVPVTVPTVGSISSFAAPATFGTVSSVATQSYPLIGSSYATSSTVVPTITPTVAAVPSFSTVSSYPTVSVPIQSSNVSYPVVQSMTQFVQPQMEMQYLALPAPQVQYETVQMIPQQQVTSYEVMQLPPQQIQYEVLQLPAPQIQYEMVQLPPMQYIEMTPQISYIPHAPPAVPLPLPAPEPRVETRVETKIVEVKVKDETQTLRIAELEKELKRVEGLLVTAREAEASLRLEISELRVKINVTEDSSLKLELTRFEGLYAEAQRRITIFESERTSFMERITFLEGSLRSSEERIRFLEAELAALRLRLETRAELHSRTSVHETYKVKTFEMAAKLALMDGTDDGMYNGLPIEIEGEGLYRELKAAGRKPKQSDSSTRVTSSTTSSGTYKVQNFELAEKLSKMDGTDDGKYNGLPIEVVGLGLYSDLVASGYRSSASANATTTTTTTGYSSPGASLGGSTTSSQTYKVANMDIAARLSKMNSSDDGTYKGLPIEVQGMGLYSELRARK